MSLAGSVYEGSYLGGTASNSFGTRTVATSAKITRMAKDIASGYSSDMEIIEEYFRQGNVDSAMNLRESVVGEVSNTLKEYGYTLSDGQIQSILDEAYARQNGETVLQSVSNNTNSSFMTGVKQAIPIFGIFANSTSTAEATAELSGQPTNGKEAGKEGIGKYGTSIGLLAGGALLFSVPIVGPALLAAGGLSLAQNLLRDPIEKLFN